MWQNGNKTLKRKHHNLKNCEIAGCGAEQNRCKNLVDLVMSIPTVSYFKLTCKNRLRYNRERVLRNCDSHVPIFFLPGVANIHACIHTCVIAYIHSVRMHAHIRTRQYVHACTHASMHLRIHAAMHTCLHAFMHTCINTHMYRNT